ncbi:hypothetical protein [Nonomuraea sp. LPB2021202275-12-8]|uniref:hypothetical protein n=1 Tax=Nonomuraea sp. LPB2021202275-12-8 TaxID=3120159 RepID=UPI00300CBC85
MTDQQQPGELDSAARLAQAFEQVGKAVGKAVEGWAAQGALGYAYWADYKALSKALKGMTKEQVVRTQAAAKILATACDVELLRPSRNGK